MKTFLKSAVLSMVIFTHSFALDSSPYGISNELVESMGYSNEIAACVVAYSYIDKHCEGKKYVWPIIEDEGKERGIRLMAIACEDTPWADVELMMMRTILHATNGQCS